ncbi:MAG: stage II sporulation protein P [Firmicutes bacterium]|nr:stage II sporulation protein P [Bacillota bacterium]
MLNEIDEWERQAENYYVLQDEDDSIITYAGRRLVKGDQYLDKNNFLYEVVDLDDYIVHCKFIREVNLKEEGLRYEEATIVPAAQQGNFREVIAIYHTHNAESYVPTDGSDSIYGQGGIHQVGSAMANALREKGIEVVHAQDLHLPHDRGAYRRSRVTVLRLLEENKPDAFFDVHRDAAPKEAYEAEIDNTDVAQVQFVVGRQNPNASVNRRLAYDLKNYSDEMYPGLVKGVFLTWGDFNQDLSPLNLLLEVGAHTNSRESAENGAALFADVVAFYFYGIAPGATIADRNANPPSLRGEARGVSIYEALAGIIGGLILGGIGFYFLNEPARVKELEKNLYFYLGKNSPLRKNVSNNLFLWKEGLQDIGSKILIFARRIKEGVRR